MTAEEFRAHMAEVDAIARQIVEAVGEELCASGAPDDVIAEAMERQRQALAERRREMLQRMARIIANPDAPSVALY